MANYYLPIEINNRRWHICHLNEPTQKNGIFSFIIDKSAKTLFEIPGSAKFISEGGYSGNIKLSDCVQYRVCKKNETFFVDFIKGDKFPVQDIKTQDKSIDAAPPAPSPAPAAAVQDIKTQDKSIDGLSISKDVDKSNSPYVIKINPDKFLQTSFNIVIRLLVTKNELVEKEVDGKKINRPEPKIKEEYAYGFQIHLCNKKSQNFIEAAIDFGSEASQVSCKRGNEDRDRQLCLVDLFKRFYSTYNKVDEFWQGKENDHLFKSVFFVNTGTRDKRVKFQYTDNPFRHAKESFIQILKPYTTADSNDYNNLFILPNLKLLECMSNKSQQSITIYLGNDRPENITNESANLYDECITDSSLRLILSHILYAILEENKSAKKLEQYLHIKLLMPNLYSQKKVYTLMSDLYTDFGKITKKKKYNCFKGIEIQMISESDAAFLGAKRSKASEWNIPNKKINGYFLIIDAGKGTTDFSILQQEDNFTNFNSLYRTGIPASGHVLTYAFFEALESLLKEKLKLELKKILLDSDPKDRSDVLDFMSLLEQLKITFNTNKIEAEESDINFELRTMDLININHFLKDNFLKKGFQIPGTNTKVEEKIEKLLQQIKNEINKPGIEKFERVIFTGRGFRFVPFCEAVTNMLKSEKMLVNDQIVFKNDDSTKTICIDGAFVLDSFRINNNSELIGKPQLELDNAEDDNKKGIFSKIFRRNNDYKDFFIDGIEIASKHKNFRIRVGGRTSQQFSNFSGSDCFFYFTGDGFIIQFKNEHILYDETYQTNNTLEEFVKQSLFPFYDLNIIGSQKKSSNSNTQQNISESDKTESFTNTQKSELPPEVDTQNNSQIKPL